MVIGRSHARTLPNRVSDAIHTEQKNYGLTRHDPAHGPRLGRKFGVKLVSNSAEMAGFPGFTDK